MLCAWAKSVSCIIHLSLGPSSFLHKVSVMSKRLGHFVCTEYKQIVLLYRNSGPFRSYCLSISYK